MNKTERNNCWAQSKVKLMRWKCINVVSLQVRVCNTTGWWQVLLYCSCIMANYHQIKIHTSAYKILLTLGTG